MGVRRTKSVVCSRVCLRLLLLLAVCKSASASLFSFNLCPKLHLEDALLLQEDQCLYDDGGNPVYSGMASRVAEVNGTTLERALSILQTKEDAYAVVLFYANWCHFSRTFRPLLDTLSSAFPAIYHFAVEDSAVQPSALSQYGVHSFPVLFIYNETVTVRYHGPRTAEAIGGFYKDITGIGPINHSKRDGDGIAFFEKLFLKGVVQSKVNCPYPWAKSPEKWLHDDMYLTLATIFLVLRVLIYLMPRLLSSVKYYWIQKETSLEAHKGLFRRVLLWEQDPDISSSGKNFEGDGLRKGKGVLSVPGWSSSSLAAVTLAEGSSSRMGGGQVKGFRQNMGLAEAWSDQR